MSLSKIIFKIGACLILCIKEYRISYKNTTQNITEMERKMGIITRIKYINIEMNNPFKDEGYHISLFPSKCSYLNIFAPDAPVWIDMNEEH